MKRKAGIVAGTLLMIVGFSACGADDGQPWDKKDVVIQYEGRDLHCISSQVHGGRTLTCDFVRFYNENVEPFVEPTPTGPAYEVE